MRFSLTIDKIGSSGDGIGQYDGKLVFVPFALPEEDVIVEKVKENKNGITARLVSIEKESPERISPVCKHFTQCGGCQAQHMSRNLYTQWMKDKVLKPLSGHGLDTSTVSAPIITKERTRRRLALRARKTEKGVIVGFNARESHTIVDIQECIVAEDDLVKLFDPLRDALHRILPKAGKAEIHLTNTKTGVDILFKASVSLSLADREVLTDFAEKYDIAAIHWLADDFLDPVLISREPLIDIDGTNVPIQPGGFIQASEEGQKLLIDQVREWASSSRRVADLFSGIGTFTFALAKKAQVLAAEGNAEAMNCLVAARNASSHLKQIITRKRDLFIKPLMPEELNQFDTVVIDPPRAGAKEQVDRISSSDICRVISVSCNPNTFARDAELLNKSGFKVEKIIPVDQFLYSQHIEIIALIVKK
ncbi:23S rRNA (uracil(1939)-C(5))-methyltransferase RlmD [Kordiimonas sp. SCSIO 12610]|uniref:23S rRNA (uracil(1939)-C(5))-methyltransferase RlmD n=1 Tax=Kordiimonas sp. SCSIO 12610 TaxID=2829597 RepID=UPI00210EC04D|nr:23S rRNA (uracil(1939)-C(5))-methyltransferase RlmD [Kordiimonas sp. SCSIO 12610]UTW56750.1 23S rRNA (uracil(1939)-C(5))-methyltransferase RlmD [Kordiimonas sp. SCSIO 12610]